MAFSDLLVEKNSVRFNIHDLDLSLVNGVRRAILSEVKTIAFHFDPNDTDQNKIVIKNNTGVLHSEILSHRISLIPIHFDENETYDYKPSQYQFLLKKHNQGASTISVTSADIVVIKDGKELRGTKLFPPHNITKDYILITKLKPNMYDPIRGDEIDIQCNATVGNGLMHSRYSPVSKCCFFNVVDEDLAQKMQQEKIKDAEDKESLLKRFNTLDKQRCYRKNKYDEPSEFEFCIDSVCGLRPTYIFFKGLSVIIDKLDGLDEHIIVNTLEKRFYEVVFPNESHTLLNVVQSYIYKQHFRDKMPEDNVLIYIGFYQKHPLDKNMFLKIKFKDDTDCKMFLKDSFDYIKKELTKVLRTWVTFSGLDKEGIMDVDKFMS